MSMLRFVSRVVVHTSIASALMLTTGLASAQLIDQTTYQGRLEFNGAAATGPWAVSYRVWDSAVAGAPVSVGLIRALTLAPEDDGVFAFDDLDFGLGTFDGTDRWLELVVWAESISVNGLVDPGELVETLTRQPITAAPQAQYALESGIATFAGSSGTTLNEAHANGNVIANNGGSAMVVEGGLEIGTTALTGSFDFNNSAAGAGSNIRMTPFNTAGAALVHYDENGTFLSVIQPDNQGEGIYTLFKGDGGIMEWNGDLSSAGVGSGSRLTISGPGSISRFNTNDAGDSSVALPIDAISPSETLAESGVANTRITSIAFPTTTGVLVSRSITVPASGYVFAILNGDLQFQHTSGTGASFFLFGVANQSANFDSNTDHGVNIPTSSASGNYIFPMSSSGLYSVTAGTHTFYALGKDSSSGSSGTAFDVQLTLMYFPTAYGTVQSNLIDPANPDSGNNTDVALAPMTALDIEAEYQAELARVRQEMQAKDIEQQRQLEEMRVRMEALEREQGLGSRKMD